MFSEQDRESIRIEAESLLKRFSARLSEINITESVPKNNESGMRRATKQNITDNDFRTKMFSNAPQKEGDFIIAEKKKW